MSPDLYGLTWSSLPMPCSFGHPYISTVTFSRFLFSLLVLFVSRTYPDLTYCLHRTLTLHFTFCTKPKFLLLYLRGQFKTRRKWLLSLGEFVQNVGESVSKSSLCKVTQLLSDRNDSWVQSVSLSPVPVASLVTLVLFSAYTNKNRKVYLVTSQVFFFFFQINFF